MKKLKAAAVKRGTKTATGKNHTEARKKLGDPERKAGDIEGFKASDGKLVSRREASAIGKKSGQVSKALRKPAHSHNVDWKK